MIGSRSVALVAALGVAAAVELVGLGGWWGWAALQRRLDTAPQAGARELRDAPVLVLPSTVARSRRLSGAALAGAAAQDAAAALDRVARLQRWWFPTDPSGFKNQSRAAALRGDLEEALELSGAAIDRDRTDPYVLRFAALLELSAGSYAQCLELLADAEAVAPGFRRPVVDVLPGDERWVRVEGLRRRVDLEPRNRAAGLLALAAELRFQGRSGEAWTVLEPVVDHPEVVVRTAGWDLEEGRAEEAAEKARSVAEARRFPAKLRVQAYDILARSRDLTGDEEGALAAASAALGLAPEAPGPYLTLARLAESRGDLERALEHLRRAWGIAPADVGVLLEVARVAERVGRRDDARLALQRAAEVAPDRVDLGALLVDYHLRHGELMDAALTLSRWMDRYPTDPRLVQLAGRLRAQTRSP